jgi:hypothetical protein
VQNQYTVFPCLSQQIKKGLDVNATNMQSHVLDGRKKNVQGADDDEMEEDNRPAQIHQSARRQSKRCVPHVSSVVWDGA